MIQKYRFLFSRTAAIVLSMLLLAGAPSSAAGADTAENAGGHTTIGRSDLLPDGAGMHLAGFGDPFNLAEQGGEPVSSGTSSIPGRPVEKGSAVPSVASYGKAFLPDLVDGTKRIFTPDIAPVGLGLTGLAFALDHTVDDYFQDHQPISHVSHYGDSWGQGYVPFTLGVALFATGEIIDN
jgi:hypothetical protein